jgi:hypothetical protein
MLSGVNADGIKQIVQCGDSRYWTILFVQSVLSRKIDDFESGKKMKS